MRSGSDIAQEYQVHFLDVGQGNSTVVILPTSEGGRREALVIDSANGKATIDCLRECAVSHLRLVLITHSDTDHAHGIPAVLKEYQGRTTALACNLDNRSFADKQWAQALKRLIVKGASDRLYNTAYYADVHLNVIDTALLSFEGKKFGEIFYPQPEDSLTAMLEGKPNQASAVFSLWIDEFKVLFGSDLSLDGWNKLCERLGPVREEKLRANVFQFPHHGAELNSAQIDSVSGEGAVGALTGLDLLRLIHPDIVLMSVGTQQPPNYQHPRFTTFDLLKTYRQECEQQGETVRIVCTELTARCHANPLSMRSDALEWQSKQGRPTSFAQAREHACPCGGTVSLFISTDGTPYRCEPGMEHNRFIDRVQIAGGNPGCRLL